MTKISWVLTAGTVLIGASVAMAGPASADDLNGSYTQTITDGGGRFREGSTSQLTYTPCGPGCVTETGPSGAPQDFHLQGDDYVFTPDPTRTITINKNTLQKVGVSPLGTVVFQLTKNG
jgi:hypothetical protein